MASRVLKLGTRRSALAWAQSGWVAREVERLNLECKVERVGIETQGDKIVDIPLRQVEGKEFFTAEVDRALLDGKIDFAVHSLKDLSLDRPAGLFLAAVPKRANPRDVVIFGPRIREKLSSGKALRIGTSAPRRLENLPGFLSRALPGGDSVRFEWIEIRGNVDTRLRRLREPEASERHLDAVVLALAGLSRLWGDEGVEGGREKLRPLIEGVKWVIPPLSLSPTAPGQGALAVECRANDEELKGILQKIHHAESLQEITEERMALAEFGGGCHQRFGATRTSIPGAGSILSIRGKAQDGRALDIVRWSLAKTLTKPAGEIWAWDGTEESPFEPKEILNETELRNLLRWDSVFVAHSRALPSGGEAVLSNKRVWVSGPQSWFKLAKRGVWVEGCAEGLGFEQLRPTLSEGVLALPAFREWTVLTHEGALDTWAEGQTLATYRLVQKRSGADQESGDLPAGLTDVFWSSGSQFEELKARVPSNVRHACGPGKTANVLRAAGISNLKVFPTVREWRKWLKINPKA